MRTPSRDILDILSVAVTTAIGVFALTYYVMINQRRKQKQTPKHDDSSKLSTCTVTHSTSSDTVVNILHPILLSSLNISHSLLNLFSAVALHPMDRFRALLAEGAYPADARVLNNINASAHLSTRLMTVETSEQACRLYDTALRIPQSATRAAVLEQSGVTIDGIMPVERAQEGTNFHYAFDANLPRVLKVPSSLQQAKSECELYEEIGKKAEQLQLALVPVQYLRLSPDSVVEKEHSGTKRLHAGILMPPFPCTFSSVPIPISLKYTIDTFDRLAPAIDYMHSNFWLHGDIKPSNIFISADGLLWIGDYGSSVRHSEISGRFFGGTPRYQCADFNADANPHLFDKFGLIISLLEKLGIIYTGKDSRKIDGYSTAEVVAAVGTLSQGGKVGADLSAKIMAWIK